MTRTELLDLYDNMKRLEKLLKKRKAPMSIIRNVHDARLSLNWAIDNTSDDL